MRFKILHEIKGRIRVHIIQNKMTDKEADTLQYHLEQCDFVTEAKVYERTSDAVVCFCGDRKQVLAVLQKFSYSKASVPESVLELSGRETNR